ncbi:MAG: leucine-rich repeat protein [Oscillospiraceae bacterium]|nr:leucine-rich repeat protein [Oscillospiraceae bacterium]
MKWIEVPEGVTQIPAYAFRNLSSVEEVVLPETLTEIKAYAFDGTGLKTINLIEGLTAIPAYCFYNCTSLSELVLPSTVSSVGNYAFYNCTGLRTITMNENLKTIGSYAFCGCDGVLSLVLNEGLETIYDNAFSNCDNLKAVELPSTVVTIGKNTFDGCSKLTIYCYSGTQAHMVSESEGYTIYLLDEHNHEYTTTIETAPTCTRGGSQILTCAICGYYYVEILEALGHDWGEWETESEATCVVDGVLKRVCATCEEAEIQAITAPGHVYEEVVIPPNCTADGCTVHTCTVCNDSYGDNYVDALEHRFSDWAVTKEATILECGTRTRTCSVCSKTETEQIEKITIDVENNTQYGVANFTVLDALSLTPVSGASIFIKTENDGEATITTDGNGKASQILPVGQWPIAVYADGYLVRNITITVKAGEQDIPTIGISDKPLVDATITTTEMTYEEMVEAGIDVNSSENKHYYKYEVTILFHEELELTFVSYGDGEGNIVATSSSSGTTRTVYALSHNRDEVEAEAVTIIYSGVYGTYISDRSSYTNAVWTPTIGDTLSFTNNGYSFEGYGIPSTLTMTNSRAFPNDGWTFNSSSGRLSMSVGERTHYLTFCDGEFCTVSNNDDSIAIGLFERISSEGYPTEAEYVYIPAETFETGKQYLLVQFKSISSNSREALSHDANQPDHETVTIHGDDVYGQYIVDSELFENTVWLSSTAKSEGLKIGNNHYFAQVEDTILQYIPLANEYGWVLDGEYLTTTIGEETYYLRYGNGEYHVTNNEAYAGKVMIFEKTTATDVISGSEQTDTKTIYRRVYTFGEGKEYIIVGSAKNPSGSGGGGANGGYSGGGGGGFSGTLVDGTPVTIYPVSEQFYLIIYGEVCWLKEMFDVEMLILNNSSTDTIENCVAELILPEGLSLATMVEGEQSTVQTVDYIEEGGSHSLHWYVRGDAEGSYDITATLSGTMMPFNEDFYYEYEADSPIKVYAGSAMKMTIHIPDTAYNEAKYVVKFELENVSDKVLYGVTHTITGWEQGKITYYSDGRETVIEEYGSGGTVGSKGVDALYPGDKIVLEVGFDILLESSIRKSLMETADQVEQLYESYQAVQTAIDLLNGLNGFCSSASSTLDGIINAGSITDMDKLNATKGLVNAFNGLIGLFESGDSKAVAIANNVQSSELYNMVKTCSTVAGCEEILNTLDTAEGIEAVAEFVDKVDALVNAAESTEEPYNAFDSLRTMISTIPIKYVVDDVLVSTMDGSTTTIPYDVVLTPTESPYMGVDNWGKYMYNWMITAMGKISSPWYAQMFGAPDDVTGYDDAVAYVKQVENQIAAYNVHKESGTTFRAWIEYASAADAGIAVCSSGTADGNFLIETDNETASYENGVLTFTGNAILEVTALSTEDGILYIEDDEGNVKTIVIDTVEAHTCYSDTWNVEIAPSEDFDGYRSKCCDICGDTIAIEVLTACSEHIFGDWIIEQEATEESVGIRYRECQSCYSKEIEYSGQISWDDEDTPGEENPGNEDIPGGDDVQGMTAITMSQNYIALETGTSFQLTANVQPAKFSEEVQWSVDNEEILSVDRSGNVTARNVGTAYVIATVTDGDITLTDRCRIDVTEEMVIEGIQLSTNKLNIERYSADYVTLEVLLKLPQNYSAQSVGTKNETPDLGVAIESARFTDDKIAELFTLGILDDRTLAIIPTEKGRNEAKGKYVGTITITVAGTEYESEALTLTVKNTLPKLKATIANFNSFYTGQSQEIQITGATVTNITATSLPSWLTLDGTKLTLTGTDIAKNASGKAVLQVETEEWNIPAAITLNVRNSYKAPGVKLSATNVNMSADAENSNGVQMKLMPSNKKDTLESLKVTGITASNGYVVENFNITDGTFTLKTTDSAVPGKIVISVSFEGTEEKLNLNLTLKNTAVTLKLSSTNITLNPDIGDAAKITVTATPADYRVTNPTFRLEDSKKNNKLNSGELALNFANGILTISTTDKTPNGTTYKLYISAGGSREVSATIKTVEKAPSMTLKATGSIDLSFPENEVAVTPTFKNYSGAAVSEWEYSVAEMKGKNILNANAGEFFEVEQDGNTFRVSCTEPEQLTMGNTYQMTLKLTLPNGSICENTVKLTIKQTALKLKLSATNITLNKTVSDSAELTVTSTTKGYTLGTPVWQLMDKTGKNSAEGKLDITYNNGKLSISVNESTEFAASYKLLVKASEKSAATTLTVNIPAQNRSAITGTLKLIGGIDVIRDGSSVTVTPTYKNCGANAEREERIEIYCSADKYAEPVTNLFDITRNADGTFTVTKSGEVDHTLKYQAKLVTDFGNGIVVESKLTSLKVTMGTAKLTATADSETMFAKDKNCRVTFTVASADTSLNKVKTVEIKDKKYQNILEIIDYGNGAFAIGYKEGKVDSSLIGKTVTLNLNVFLEGNESTKANGTVNLKLTFAK